MRRTTPALVGWLALLGSFPAPFATACDLTLGVFDRPILPAIGPLTLSEPSGANVFTVTRQPSPGGLTIRYLIDRPAPLTDIPFERTPELATQASDFNVLAAFVSRNGDAVIFQVLDRNHPNNPNDVRVRFEVIYEDLSVPNPVEVKLFKHGEYFGTDNPNPQFAANSDSSGLFTRVLLDVDTSPNTFDIRVFETGKGTELCGFPEGNPELGTTRNTSDVFSAEVLDVVAPAGPEAVRIRRHTSTVDFDANCAILSNLQIVTAQPLAFGTVGNTATPTLPVTFSNAGIIPVRVSFVPSGHFAPTSTTPFTLDCGQSATRQIQFSPSNTNGSFDETISILTEPSGVVVTQLRCTGTAIPSVTVTRVAATVGEGNTLASAFQFSRTGTSTGSLTVNVGLGGTATPSTAVGTPNTGADFVRLPATVTFLSGSSTTEDLITIQDPVREDNQTVTRTVLTGTGYLVGSPSSATVSITDDDPFPIVSIFGRTVPEGGTPIVADVILSQRSEIPISVAWNTFTGVLAGQLPGTDLFSTATPGSRCSTFPITAVDFVTSSGTVPFSPGITSGTISVPICVHPDAIIKEGKEKFFIRLSQFSNVTLGISNYPGATTCSIEGSKLVIGSFALTPTDATIGANEPLAYAFTWTVPDGEVWRDLNTLDFRIRGDHRTAIWVHWDEQDNTFSLCERRGGPKDDEDDRGDDEDDDRGDDVGDDGRDRPGQASHETLDDKGRRVRCTDGAAPGSPVVLETRFARLHLAQTTVVGSGPTGTSVTLNLSISFKPRAAHRIFAVEVAASDDIGNREDFIRAGTVQVGKAPKESEDSALADQGPGDAPLEFALRSSSNPVTQSRSSISFSIPAYMSGAHVEIAVLDVTGRKVRTLVSNAGEAGRHTVEWDLRDEHGSGVANGIFFYRIRAGGQLKTQKFIVMRR